MKRIIKLLTLFAFTIFLLFTFEIPICAQGVIKSDNFEIQMPNLNSGAGIPSSTNFGIDSTIGQTAAGLFSSTGYRVKSGFQYIHSIIPFSFQISKLAISFGTLIPGTPATDSHTLTVSAGGAGGYQVKAFENNPLRTFNNLSTIADTSCNSSCDEETAGEWTQDTKYGFGFNVSGDDVPGDFINDDYFRQFADLSFAEIPQVVMSSIYVGRSRQALVTYKVNVSGVQEAGTYSNIITYVAIPTY
ncbi:MAG: hypothetical protein ABIJ05_03060 [Patescibacteria group bacterium]